MSALLAAETGIVLEKIIGPWARRIQHQLGANIEFLVAQAIARPHADDALAFPEKSHGLGVIRNHRTALGRRLDEGEHQPRGVIHLSVLEDGPARQCPRLEFRKQLERLIARQQPGAGNAARAIGDARILAGGQQIVGEHPSRQKRLALPAVAVGRNHNGQGIDQMRRDAQ